MCYFQFNTIKFSKNVQPFSDASKSLKIFRRRSEGAAEGGCGGNSAAPERRSPAAPPEYLEGETEQKFPFPFLNFFQGARAKEKL